MKELEDIFRRKREFLREAKQRDRAPAELLKAAEAVLRKREAAMKKIPPALVSGGLRPADRPEGTPLVDLANPGWLSASAAYLRRLIQSWPSRDAAQKKELEEIAGGEDLQGALSRALRGETLEKDRQRNGAAGALFVFLLGESLRPFLILAALRSAGHLQKETWAQGYCPLCGGFPAMGEIREEGKRILHCQLCWTEWVFPRLKCPYCGNDDQEKLTYFQVTGEAGNRVDVCLSCRHYLKTIDSRERGEIDAEMEDYLTLHLDQLAQQEGYTRPRKLILNS